MQHQDSVICRCEQVTLGEILEVIRTYGASTPGEVKMLSRACQGFCGGRTCVNLVGRIVAAEAGWSLTEGSLPRSRVPVRPVLLDEIGDPNVDASFGPNEARFDLLDSGEKND